MPEKRRVVVTGMGVVSCLGNNQQEVAASLKQGRSGIVFRESYREAGLRSQIAGAIRLNPADHIDRKALRFMGDAAAFTCIAMREAIADAGLSEAQISHPRTGLIVGSGGASPHHQIKAVDILREKGIRKVGAFMVPRTMNSTVSACLSVAYKIKGVNYSITSACSTSAHCIGDAMEKIQHGQQDIVFAGGGEEESWEMTLYFDAMGALSTKYNDAPETASRPFDATRDGFVIAGGGGILALEEREAALRRGAKIHAEITGYGCNSDGDDMVVPSGEGAARCMRQALDTVDGPIDYINAHGTSTPQGDMAELRSIRDVFGDNIPPISSTKSQTGHSLGATGAHEAIYSLLMMRDGFISPTINLKNRDEEAKGFPIVTETRENVRLERVMSNSFGFGGTNATLVFQKI